VDRFVSNTLRTIGIILISVFVIGASLILILFALCLGALSSGNGHANNSGNTTVLFAIWAVVCLFIVLGILFVARLAKGITHNLPEYVPEDSTTETPSQVAGGLAAPASASDVTGRELDLAHHLSPASREAIRQLSTAIGVKVLIEILIGLSGLIYSFNLRPAPFTVFRYSFLVWVIASVAPLLVLLYALARHPGPRAFAYALVIPSLQIFFGFFGNFGAMFALFSRAVPGVHPALSLLSLLPWLFDILILYLAWKAIRRTGIQPNSTRLIVASVVIFLYTSFLPGVLVLANIFLRPR